MRNERHSLQLEPPIDSSTPRSVDSLKPTSTDQVISSVATRPVTLWGGRSPANTRRPACLWALYHAILRQDAAGVAEALAAKSSEMEYAPDTVTSLMRLSPRLVPNHPILCALDLAHRSSPQKYEYLYQLLARREDVGQMTPEPDSDEAIMAYIESLNDSALEALFEFVLQNEDPNESIAAAPAA